MDYSQQQAINAASSGLQADVNLAVLISALSAAPVGALIAQFAGIGPVMGYDSVLVGAVTAAALVGYKSYYDSGFPAKYGDKLLMVGLAAAGYMYGPRYGYSDMIGAAAGAAAGYVANKYILPMVYSGVLNYYAPSK